MAPGQAAGEASGGGERVAPADVGAMHALLPPPAAPKRRQTQQGRLPEAVGLPDAALTARNRSALVIISTSCFTGSATRWKLDAASASVAAAAAAATCGAGVLRGEHGVGAGGG